jgi:hypothetical protein
MGASGGNWDGLKEGKREKDELIDIHIVESLRKGRFAVTVLSGTGFNSHIEIGDPFQDSILKRYS